VFKRRVSNGEEGLGGGAQKNRPKEFRRNNNRVESVGQKKNVREIMVLCGGEQGGEQEIFQEYGQEECRVAHIVKQARDTGGRGGVGGGKCGGLGGGWLWGNWASKKATSQRRISKYLSVGQKERMEVKKGSQGKTSGTELLLAGTLTRRRRKTRKSSETSELKVLLNATLGGADKRGRREGYRDDLGMGEGRTKKKGLST